MREELTIVQDDKYLGPQKGKGIAFLYACQKDGEEVKGFQFFAPYGRDIMPIIEGVRCIGEKGVNADCKCKAHQTYADYHSKENKS